MNSLRPLMIGALVLTEVGLWQWRMLIAGRGHRAAAMLLGALGATLQITAITQVVTNINDLFSIVAYAAGVGLGVLLGLVAGEHLTPGTIRVTITTTHSSLASDLWARGWPATVYAGQASAGPVAVLSLAISRRSERRLAQDIARLAPDAAWSSEELRETAVSGLPIA